MINNKKKFIELFAIFLEKVEKCTRFQLTMAYEQQKDSRALYLMTRSNEEKRWCAELISNQSIAIRMFETRVKLVQKDKNYCASAQKVVETLANLADTNAVEYKFVETFLDWHIQILNKSVTEVPDEEYAKLNNTLVDESEELKKSTDRVEGMFHTLKTAYLNQSVPPQFWMKFPPDPQKYNNLMKTYTDLYAEQIVIKNEIDKLS